jgi:hypothetical protein
MELLEGTVLCTRICATFLTVEDPSKSVGKMPVVDSEDLPKVEGTRRDGLSRNNFDREVRTTPAKNTFATSRPDTDPDWDGRSVSDGGSTTWQTEHGSTSPNLAEMLLASISPEAEARRNRREAVLQLYLQRIRTQDGTILELERKNYALQNQLYSAERRADKLKMRMKVLEMMRTYHRRSSRHHRTHHRRTPSSSSGSNKSASSTNSTSSRSPSRSMLKRKLRRVDLQAAEEREKEGWDKEEEALGTS